MWTAYRVVFKLRSPLHVGCGKVSNLQRTRTYVTGRVFWGALTMRLTRDATSGAATDSRLYRDYGKKVHEQLAFTYFYPAIQKDKNDWKCHFSWQAESQFRRRFLSSYSSTALVYPQQAADEGLLHEVEFLSPRTLDEGKQVYLLGYVFEKKGCDLNWQEACGRLQFGGERGYGWGDVQCVKGEPVEDNRLFEDKATFDGTGEKLRINTKELLAHTYAENVTAEGEIEPLVGREWKVAHRAGESVEFSGVCWVPGSEVEQALDFEVDKFGIWQLPTAATPP